MSMTAMHDYDSLLPNCKIIHPNIWLMYVRDGLPIYKKLFHKILSGVQKICLSVFHRDVTPLYIRIGSNIIGSNKYDCVVCFSESIAKFVCHYPAHKKVVWVHCEFSRIFQQVDEKVYSKFDSIVCVSNYGKTVFDRCLPVLLDKSIAIHNVIDVGYMTEKSKDVTSLDNRFDTSVFTILTIGRIDPIKQMIIIPHIASEVMRRSKLLFKWYIIGDGKQDEKQAILNEIKKNNVYQEVILLGEKENVYPYISKSNLYVNTSKSEAYSLVNNEAKALGIPVITNNFQCASETIIDGVDGLVTTIDRFPDAIINVMNNKSSRKRSSIDNTTSLDKFYNLFL